MRKQSSSRQRYPVTWPVSFSNVLDRNVIDSVVIANVDVPEMHRAPDAVAVLIGIETRIE